MYFIYIFYWTNNSLWIDPIFTRIRGRADRFFSCCKSGVIKKSTPQICQKWIMTQSEICRNKNYDPVANLSAKSHDPVSDPLDPLILINIGHSLTSTSNFLRTHSLSQPHLAVTTWVRSLTNVNMWTWTARVPMIPGSIEFIWRPGKVIRRSRRIWKNRINYLQVGFIAFFVYHPYKKITKNNFPSAFFFIHFISRKESESD